MKKLLGFLFGLATMIMVFGAIYVAASIYDTSEKFAVEPRFLRTSIQSYDLPGMPHSWAEVGKRKLRDWLIQKYVTEYFYVVPDDADIARRTARNSALRIMSGAAALEYWRQNELPEIESLVADGARRTVTVFNEIYRPAASNYWRVDYELKTWYKPNDMSERPKITRGTMYLDLGDEYRVGHIGDVLEGDVHGALKRGIDPALVFVFNVQRVLVEEK